MKVICIDGIKLGDIGFMSGDKSPATCDKEEEIFEGESYTVSNTRTFYGKRYFLLKEKPFTTRYNERRFMPLSNINEEELAVLPVSEVSDLSKRESNIHPLFEQILKPFMPSFKK